MVWLGYALDEIIGLPNNVIKPGRYHGTNIDVGLAMIVEILIANNKILAEQCRKARGLIDVCGDSWLQT